MKDDVLFKALRSSVFGGSLTQDQVNGVNACLAACAAEQVADMRQVAAVLATPMIETGGSFVPKVESLNYSVDGLKTTFGDSRISAADRARLGRSPAHNANQEAIANIVYGGPWGVRNLGNTQPGDGWAYRGRGLCQITGRANYAKFGKLLGIPLEANPDLATDLTTAAAIMVVGMRDGLFRVGCKLGRYFDATHADWEGARDIINGGGDKVAEYGRAGRAIFAALNLAA